MPIDVATESLKTLAKAAQTLPGGLVSVSTMHRWRTRGVRAFDDLDRLRKSAVHEKTIRECQDLIGRAQNWSK